MKDRSEKPPPNGDSRRLTRGLGVFSIGLGLAEVAAPKAISRAIGVSSKGHTAAAMRAMGAREIGHGVAILSRPQHPALLWARVVGDVIDLALLGYALGAKRRSSVRLGIAIGAVVAVAVIDVLASRRARGKNHGG